MTGRGGQGQANGECMTGRCRWRQGLTLDLTATHADRVADEQYICEVRCAGARRPQTSHRGRHKGAQASEQQGFGKPKAMSTSTFRSRSRWIHYDPNSLFIVVDSGAGGCPVKCCTGGEHAPAAATFTHAQSHILYCSVLMLLSTGAGSSSVAALQIDGPRWHQLAPSQDPGLRSRQKDPIGSRLT